MSSIPHMSASAVRKFVRYVTMRDIIAIKRGASRTDIPSPTQKPYLPVTLEVTSEEGTKGADKFWRSTS